MNGNPQQLLLAENHLYFNGFSMGVGNGDVIITLLLQGKPIQTLNVSYTIAKTLGIAISEGIKQLEQKCGRQIMTATEVGEGLSESGK